MVLRRSRDERSASRASLAARALMMRRPPPSAKPRSKAGRRQLVPCSDPENVARETNSARTSCLIGAFVLGATSTWRACGNATGSRGFYVGGRLDGRRPLASHQNLLSEPMTLVRVGGRALQATILCGRKYPAARCSRRAETIAD